MGVKPDHSKKQVLLDLSHQLGDPAQALAILGEGNTSTKAVDGTFWVKASGSSLATLDGSQLTECRLEPLLALLKRRAMKDAEMSEALLACRTDAAAKKPSVEAVFHAWLLTLPGVDFVGHTHPIAVNGLLCSRYGRLFASRRLFPDDIVCCGEASVYVPYTDPGLKLAQAIRRETLRHLDRVGEVPRVILLENHGLIALGPTPQAVLAATLMAEKSAKIFLAAASTGQKPRFLTPANVARISQRPDEHHRRRILGL